MISFAILIIPFLSVTKGFLQGHKYIAPTSVSQILEQIIMKMSLITEVDDLLRMINEELKD